MMKRVKILLISFVFIAPTYGQKIVSATDAVNSALRHSGNLAATDLAVLQQKQLLKGSFNLPNPEVFVESPTGNFYTVSITQTSEFPTVYKRQHQLQKEKIVLAEKEKDAMANEIKFQVRQIYLTLQYTYAVQQQLYLQDTIYENISKAASRQFGAGQIDYLQKTFSEAQYGDIHNQYLQTGLMIGNLQNQLQFLTGMTEAFLTEPLNINPLIETTVLIDSTAFSVNPTLQIVQQSALIAQKNVLLQKAKALPGLAFGYFNQGEKNTVFQNRFRIGTTIPLWQGQYKSSISAAKTEVDISKQKMQGVQQQITFQLLEAQNNLLVSAQSLNYYQKSGIKKSTDMIETAKRFFQNGENDYINYLRNINDGYATQLKYLEVVRNYNQSIININYLKGTL